MMLSLTAGFVTGLFWLQRVEQLAKSLGFKQVSTSSALVPMVRAVPRGLTATVDAYLTPVIREYLSGFLSGAPGFLFCFILKTQKPNLGLWHWMNPNWPTLELLWTLWFLCFLHSGFDEGLEKVGVSFMQSDGGLTPEHRFSGHKVWFFSFWISLCTVGLFVFSWDACGWLCENVYNCGKKERKPFCGMLPTAAAVLSLILLNLKLDKTLENMFSPWYFSQEPYCWILLSLIVIWSQAILSGPAGGVVGYAQTTFGMETQQPVIYSLLNYLLSNSQIAIQKNSRVYLLHLYPSIPWRPADFSWELSNADHRVWHGWNIHGRKQVCWELWASSGDTNSWDHYSG